MEPDGAARCRYWSHVSHLTAAWMALLTCALSSFPLKSSLAQEPVTAASHVAPVFEDMRRLPPPASVAMGEHIRIVTEITENLQAKAVRLRQELEEERSAFRRARATVHNQDAKARNQRTRLEQRIAHLDRQRRELEGKLETQNQRIQSVLETAQNGEREERRLRQRLHGISQQLDVAKQENLKLAAALEERRKELQSLATARATLSIVRKKLQQRSDLAGQLQKLHDQFTALQQERNELLAQASQDQEKQRLKMQAIIRDKVARAEEAKQTAIDEARTLRAQTDRLSAEIVSLRERSHQLAEIRASNRKLQSELATLSARRDEVAARHRSLQRQATNAQALHDRCVADAETFRRSSEQRVSALEHAVTRLKAGRQRLAAGHPRQKTAILTAAMPQQSISVPEKTKTNTQLSKQSAEVKLKLIDGAFTVTGHLVRYVGTHYFVSSPRLGSIKLDARRFRCISRGCPKLRFGGQ